MKKCEGCKDQVPELFACFDQGEKIYCSDCQMAAENEYNEHREFLNDQD